MEALKRTAISALIIAGIVICIWLMILSIGRAMVMRCSVAITDESIPESADVKHGDLVDLIRVENDVKVGDTLISVNGGCGLDVAIVKEANNYEAFSEITLLGSEKYSEDQIINLSKAYLYRLAKSSDWPILGCWQVAILIAVAGVVLCMIGGWWCLYCLRN